MFVVVSGVSAFRVAPLTSPHIPEASGTKKPAVAVERNCDGNCDGSIWLAGGSGGYGGNRSLVSCTLERDTNLGGLVIIRFPS